MVDFIEFPISHRLVADGVMEEHRDVAQCNNVPREMVLFHYNCTAPCSISYSMILSMSLQRGRILIKLGCYNPPSTSCQVRQCRSDCAALRTCHLHNSPQNMFSTSTWVTSLVRGRIVTPLLTRLQQRCIQSRFSLLEPHIGYLLHSSNVAR